MQTSGIRHIGIHAFLKGKLRIAAHVVPLPVARTRGAFAPVFFHVVPVDVDAVCRAFVKPREISAQHDEIRTHRQRERHMVIVYDAAIGADGDIDARFLKIFVSRRRNLNDCRSLSAADAFLLPCDADGTAADADFYEIRAAFRKETEAFCVYYVARTDFYTVAIGFTHPVQCHLLPFAVSFGGIDAEDICAGFYQSRNALFVIPCIDARAHNVTLLGIQQFVCVFFMAVIIFTEYQILQASFCVQNRELVDFIVPDDVVGFFQRCAFRRADELVERSHKFFYFHITFHTADAVITACYKPHQLALCGAVCRDRGGRVACPRFQV